MEKYKWIEVLQNGTGPKCVDIHNAAIPDQALRDKTNKIFNFEQPSNTLPDEILALFCINGVSGNRPAIIIDKDGNLCFIQLFLHDQDTESNAKKDIAACVEKHNIKIKKLHTEHV